MQAFIIKAGSTSLEGLVMTERPTPSPGPGQVLLKMRAAALNYRDLLVPAGTYLSGVLQQDMIPLSDGCGEVVALGEGVDRFNPGDRLCPTFFRHWPDGPPARDYRPSLGADVDGVLAEYVVVNQQDAVRVPDHLSDEEAATLPCAGVTAWHALMAAGRPLRAGDDVLVLGTGGVSMMALQLARAAGARVIATSSSDSKLEKARALGASHLINYRAQPEWQDRVLEITEGRGVDCVIEVGGLGTLSRSMTALAMGGKICMIGFVAGPGEANPQQVMRSGGNLHGIFVGNRAMFEQLNRAVTVNGLRPLVDRSFSFDESVAAYHYLRSQQHVGKVVIRWP